MIHFSEIRIIAAADIDTPEKLGEMKVLHLTRLLAVTLPNAIGQWVRTYYSDNRKQNLFVRRYDSVVSEPRSMAFAV